MPIHSLRKLLAHQHLNTTQLYARVYDETLSEQFKAAMSRLEAIPVDNWPAGVPSVKGDPTSHPAEAARRT